MADPTTTKPRRAPERGPSWGHWAFGVAVVLLLVIVVQNSQEVRVKILFGEFNAPLILALLIAAALGAVIGYVAPFLRRQRRAERRAEGE